MRTPQEWLDEFNLYTNNLASNKAPGYEPYEISVLLTRAEESVVIGLYTGSISMDSFEATEALTSYLDSLVKQVTISDEVNGPIKFCDDSHIYKLPKDLLFRTLESCTVNGTCGESQADVIPVTQDELLRTLRNPFRGPTSRRVLRLSYSTIHEGEYGNNNIPDSGSSSGGHADSWDESRYSELISKYPIKSYTVRYLERPKPIIVEDLPAGYVINDEVEAMTCLLPEAIHPLILERAAQLAKAVWNN